MRRWTQVSTAIVILAGLTSLPTLPRATALELATQAEQEDGAALFRSHCASCHGTSGRGDGAVAEFLRVPPTDLTSIARRAGGTYPAERVHRAIDGRQRVRGHGATDMPVWGGTLSPSLAGVSEATTRRRIEALVDYIASLQQREASITVERPSTHGR